MRKYQRGFIDIPKGVLETMFVLAVVGLFSLACVFGTLLWWLYNHIQFV